MFYTTPRLTSDSWYKEPSSDLGDEANWLEVAESAADSLLKSNSLLSGHWNLDKTYDDHIAKVKEITGKELRNPTSLTYGVYESDDERRRFNADLAKYREDGGSLSDWGYSKQWREQEFRRQLGELAAAHPDKTSELLPDMSFLEQSYGVARKAQDREHAVWDRSDKGIGAWSASLAGALWGSAQDPVNWITAPIGFSGVGTGAKGLAMGFLKAGTANAAVEAAVQPFVQSYRSEAGLDSGAEQAATAIGGAFLFGGALDTTVRGIARGLRYSFGYEPIIVNGVVRGYRKRGAAPAIADGAAPSAPGQAEPPPAVDIPAELLVRAEKNDRAAIEEIDRIIRGGDDTVITQRTVDQADAGDPKAIREIAEKTGVAGDPIARQSLDAMDANEMLRVKPSDRVPDVDHDAAIAQGLRHASDPEIEPPPVVRDGATPQAMSDIRDMVDDLRAEIKRLEDDVASRPDAKPPADMPDLRIKLAEAESSYRQMRRAIYDDGVIERVDAGDIPPDVADLVAAHVPDKAAQGRAIDDLMARNPGSAREARQMLSEMLASPDYRPDPVDTSPPPAGLKTKALDDPYGKEAAQQVDALKQKMSDELGIGKTQPTPEQQAAEIKAIVDRGDEVRKAIEDMAGLIPEGVPVKTFTALSDLPDSIRAEVEASNALLFADAVIRFQTARSTAERDAARRFLDMAKAGRGVEGIARGGTIWIATYAMNPRGSVAHEVLHVLRTMGKISPAEIKALAEFARNEGLFSPAREATYRKELARRWNAADVVSDILDEEAAAHAVEYRANLGRRLVEPPQVKTVLDRLAEFFAAIRDALKRKGFVAEGDAAPRTAATDVLEAFMSGEMIKRHGELAWMRSFMQAEDLTAVAVRPGYMAAFSSDGGEYRGQHGTPERAKTAGAVTDHSDVYPLKEGRHQIDENGSRLVYKVRDDGSIQIDAVNSLPESAGRGQVRKMVEGLLSVADANNRVVRLDFDPSGDTDPARLRAFYTRLGFTGDRNMVRGPAGPNGDRTGGQADTAGRLNRSLFAFADDKPVTPGLDMSYEARMQRARDMGFDTDNVLFHGTSGDDFEKFTARHQTSGMGLPGVYMTPDANYAATYSGTADGSRIMPLFVRGKIASPAEYQAIWDSVYDNTGGRFSGPALTRLVQDEMLRRGYTGKSSLYENEWPVVVVFDPRNIRSVNAAFDPANADSPNLMFAFAGERAKTADLNALNLAKRMELDGIDRDDIWVKTGWGRGVDGKWRFEIDDSDAQFFGPRGKNLGEWFYTPAYAAYPDLEQIKTPRFEAMMAGRGENAVYRRSLGPIREAMGFGREVEDDAGIHEVQHAIAAREDFEAGGTGFDIMLGRYDRLAGEVEARTVQKRMDMTAAERRARPMWHDYDVPEEQQIVRFGDGVQNSEPMFALAAEGKETMRRVASEGVTLPDGSKINGVTLFAIRAFHGSPHDFRKFSLDKIGTGEGAQAYGHGLYFAENDGVAKWYKETLASGGKISRPSGEPIAYRNGVAVSQWSGDAAAINRVVPMIERSSGDMNAALTAVRNKQSAVYKKIKDASSERDSLWPWQGKRKVEIEEQLKQLVQDKSAANMDVNVLRNAIARGEILSSKHPDPGRMYEVRINADPDDFLDWDKPLSQQSERVRSALRGTLVERGIPKPVADYLPNSDRPGRDALTALARGEYDTRVMPPEGEPAALASAKLREAGIPGIRYLDQGSRTAGEGSRNYVVFDDSLIEIVAIDGKPVGSEPLFSIRQDEPDAFDWGDRSTSGSRETKFGNTTITYGVQPRTKYAQVILVETAKADRGQGSAREAMKRFVAEADRNGFTVSLTAEPMGKGGMGKADLVKFYKSLGFVENKGRNKDFAVMAGMIRQPRNQPMFAMAQDQETGRSMRRDLDALGYYSAALEAAKNLKQAKGTPEQMISQLKAGGAKQAELEATGLLKWLEEKSGSRESGKDAGSGAVTEASRRDGVDGVLDAIAKLKRAQVDMEDERLLRALEANVVNARHAARREWERTRQAVDQTVAEAKTGTPITVQGYHGSNRVIEGGVFRGSGYRRFNDLPGTWFATERFVASEYVHGDGSLHVADIHLANPVVIDAGGASLMSIDDLRQRQREWQETGHDGLIVRGINDFDLQPHTQIWVWNAESITGTSVVGPNGDRTSGTSGRADRLKQPSISKSEIVEFLEKNRVGVKEAQRINAPSVEPPAMPQPKPSEGPFKTLLDQARDALARVEEVRQAAGDGGARLVRDATGLAQQIVKAGRRMSVVRDDDGRVTGLSPVSDEIQDAIAQAAEAIAPLVEAARKAGLSDIATALPQYADQLRNAAPDDLVRLAAEVMQTTDIDAIARALDDAVMQRSQPMFAFRRDDGTQKPGGKTRAQMLQEDLAAIEAQFANASGDERKKLHAERAVLLNAEKLEERLDDLDRYRDHWNRRDTPMAAMFSVENTGQAPFHDLSSWRDEIMGRVERMISGPIWGWRKGAVTGDLRRTLNSGVKLNMQNFVREAAGESTKDQLAKEFAKSWLAATEYLRQRFNAAGGDIAKLTGWFMPQWHDADALIKAGREQWVEFILPLLDRKRIVDHDTGVPMTDSALRTMLKEIWRTITSDGYNSLEIGDHMGRGALYKRHMEHRVLHFKNADSWLKYNNEYGGGDVYAAMISYISSMSRDIALMERFGANPELTWHRLKQFVIQEAKLAGPAKSLFDEFSGKIEELRAERKSLPSRIDELRDDLNTTLTTIDRLREEGKKSIRKENRNRGKISELSRDLPAKVKAIEDVLRSGDVQTPKQIELTNRIADLMVEMTEAGAYSVTSRNPVERAERLLQRADEMWKAFAGTTNTPISSTVAGVMSGARNWIGATTLVFAPFSAVTDQATQLAARSFIGMPATRQLASFVSGFTKGSREWALAQGFALDQAQAAFASQNRFVGWTNTRHLTGYIADRSHAFSLLSPMTQATKIGWYLDFTRWMGTLKDKEVIELPDDVQRLFDRHDISGSDWDAIRSAQLEDVNGMPGLTPLMVDKAVGEDLASKYVRMIVRERKQAVVEPTLRGRTAFVSETRPGTPAGELLRSVAMLKSFPTSYMLLIMGRLYHEIMAGRGLKPSTISYGAAVFIVGTLMGAMAKQLKAIGQGRDPEDMTQAKFWAAAFMQSGGVGIFGDFIGSSINRFGGGLAQTIAGPVADRATTLLDLTAGNLAQYANDEKTNAGRELTKFLRQNTPGMLAPWYVRTAYERLIVDKLQELVDPDVHRSYRQRVLTNRKVRPGNEFYWPPGSASRPRMPDLGAAFGAR